MSNVSRDLPKKVTEKISATVLGKRKQAITLTVTIVLLPLIFYHKEIDMGGNLDIAISVFLTPSKTAKIKFYRENPYDCDKKIIKKKLMKKEIGNAHDCLIAVFL
ncbi:hypothetical protein SAMN05446037_102169 [Anaerovirgula multivorans]|uniref:Uncharacterized protein n=1 Tax=Anaerovirgula multivorans TaxID=312168 RepID=A0A239HIB6_9FIRM|nr:hypothetical protein [Anaerovirgula multivorans]SNS80024.1 hypothetical protein SAMN05446037_102169 [Anaerovirgula multivorans]